MLQSPSSLSHPHVPFFLNRYFIQLNILEVDREQTDVHTWQEDCIYVIYIKTNIHTV